MNDHLKDNDDWTTTNAKSTLSLGYWTAAWVASMTIAAFGPKLAWDFAVLPTVIGVLVHLGAGCGMILANKRYLTGLDELQQKIFLEAGALTLGVGLVAGLGYELLEDIRLISFEPEISHLVMLMCLVFMVGMINGNRKYR